MKTGKILAALLCLLACSISAEAKDRKAQSESDIVSQLKKLMTCEASPSVKGARDCTVRFRGTDVSFVGIGSPGGTAAMYVNDVGNNQKLKYLGNKCILIEFLDPDLTGDGKPTLGIGIGVIFHDTGNIAYNHRDSDIRKKCE
jgi:hypothetical protein